MIEFNESLMGAAADEVGEMADGLDKATKDSHPDSIKSSIQRAIDEEMTNPILERAKQLGDEHVGDRVQYIKPVKGKWAGDVYTAGIGSDNDVVLSHEYGSGLYHSGEKYKIEAGDNGPLAFRMNGRPIRVNYVMHPGVRGKRFMQQAVRERADEVARDAADEAQQTLEEALST